MRIGRERRRKAKQPRVWNPDPAVLRVVRVLLLLQGGFAVLSTAEVAITGLVTGFLIPLAPSIALTGLTAAVFLGLAARIPRRSRRARRTVVVTEVLVIVVALVDLALAVFLAQAPLALVPLITRFCLPLGVLVLVRRKRLALPASRLHDQTPAVV